MILRDYQQQCVDRLRAAFKQGHRRVLLVAPTGAGKTVMFSHLTQRLTERGNRVLLLAHRDFLLDQIAGTLARFDIPHGFIAAKRKPQLCHLAQVAGVHTLKSRTGKIAWQPDWIICDEAHRTQYGFKSELDKKGEKYRYGLAKYMHDALLHQRAQQRVGLGRPVWQRHPLLQRVHAACAPRARRQARRGDSTRRDATHSSTPRAGASAAPRPRAA